MAKRCVDEIAYGYNFLLMMFKFFLFRSFICSEQVKHLFAFVGDLLAAFFGKFALDFFFFNGLFHVEAVAFKFIHS